MFELNFIADVVALLFELEPVKLSLEASVVLESVVSLE